MATYQELLAAIQHVQAATGDPGAWTRGLAPQERELTALIVDPGRADVILAKIRANHPTLFDARTGVPIAQHPPPPTVPNPHEEQQGVGAEAIKKAEHDLAQQNSSTAQLDLLVVAAILNAHTTTRDGVETLTRLQREIDDAVRARTDLDTPAGARDFQRYLIGKLRQIGAIVETVSLDDSSKAALAGAWTALYESSKQVNGIPERSPASVRESAAAQPVAAADPLPAYGADVGDPALDALPGLDDPIAVEPASTVPQSMSPSPPAMSPQSMPQPAMAPMMPALPFGSGGSPGAGQPAALPLAPFDDQPLAPASARRTPSDIESLDDLLEGLPAEDTPDADDSAPDDSKDAAPDEDPTEPTAATATEPTTVRLPDGEIITARTPQLAKAISAVIAGTPIGEAFHAQGITIPPPGTAVPHPVDPARLAAGDIGMFTDRQAVALDQRRALLNGQIQPVSGVSGPSFLGWLHPPDAVGTAPAAPSATTPNGAAAPPPTRPAAAGYAR